MPYRDRDRCTHDESPGGAVELPQIPSKKPNISGYPSLCLDCGERDQPGWRDGAEGTGEREIVVC
jgi:hypothetical protein